MTVTTTAHAGWSRPAAELAPAEPAVDAARTGATMHRAAVAPAVLEHARRIAAGELNHPDPEARRRMAETLFAVTGWAVFAADGASHDRDYVSRLWAEDWDSDEDAVYDDL